ncbi:MAG: response regulator [bacterium]|nr:response regulator [bacterium]
MSELAARVLVVEDEQQMLRFLRTALTAQGYEVREAVTAAESIVEATTHNPELILLDLGLPDGDGIDLTRRFREWTRVPIIVISARGREDDKVAALDAGADDYLTKPFSVNELLARMRVALRHAAQAGTDTSSTVIEVGELRVDQVRREVAVGGREVRLTPTEYRLLVLMAANAGKVLTHRQILKAVWGPPYMGETHYLRVFMAQLRRKIEADPARPRLLVTEPGWATGCGTCRAGCRPPPPVRRPAAHAARG